MDNEHSQPDYRSKLLSTLTSVWQLDGMGLTFNDFPGRFTFFVVAGMCSCLAHLDARLSWNRSSAMRGFNSYLTRYTRRRPFEERHTTGECFYAHVAARLLLQWLYSVIRKRIPNSVRRLLFCWSWFRGKHLLKNITRAVDKQIVALCNNCVGLKKAFLDSVIFTTEITVV